MGRGWERQQPEPAGSGSLPASWWDSHHPSSRPGAAHSALLSAGQKSINFPTVSKFPPLPCLLFPPTLFFFLLFFAGGSAKTMSSFPTFSAQPMGRGRRGGRCRRALISNRSPGMELAEPGHGTASPISSKGRAAEHIKAVPTPGLGKLSRI